jgi:hypothetical protein
MPAKRSDWFWASRVAFLQATQTVVPEFGNDLRRLGLPSQGPDRRRVIREWQDRFHLPEEWVGECAWTTLAMWDRDRESRKKLTWFGVPSRNLAEIDVPVFKFAIERSFEASLGFAWFKRSVVGALEEALHAFGERHGIDMENVRQPRDLTRAFDCLALRRCKQLSPVQISKLPAYARDWTTLSRDMRAAARHIGLKLPSRGRPKRESAS